MKINICDVKHNLYLDHGDRLKLGLSLWDKRGTGGYRFGDIHLELASCGDALSVIVRGDKRFLRQVKLKKQEEEPK